MAAIFGGVAPDQKPLHPGHDKLMHLLNLRHNAPVHPFARCGNEPLIRQQMVGAFFMIGVGDEAGFAVDLLFELGKVRFRAFGVTKVDVSIKNMSSKNIISVNDDILKFGSRLFDGFNAIFIIFLNHVYKIDCQVFMQKTNSTYLAGVCKKSTN